MLFRLFYFMKELAGRHIQASNASRHIAQPGIILVIIHRIGWFFPGLRTWLFHAVHKGSLSSE
jgi:hypothetical protein